MKKKVEATISGLGFRVLIVIIRDNKDHTRVLYSYSATIA